MRIHHVSPDIPSIIYLWMLRALVPLGGYQQFIGRPIYSSNEGITKALSYINETPIDLSESKPKVILAHLCNLHQVVERKWCGTKVPPCLGNNIIRLSELLGLSETDCRILEFVIMVKNESLLNDVTETLGDLSPLQLYRVLAILLGLPEREIKNSLNARSILIKSGLVEIRYKNWGGQVLI